MKIFLLKLDHKFLYLVNIVKNTNTSLVLAPLLLFSVIWLSFPQPPSMRPITVATSSWGWNSLASRSPVPAILYQWLQVFPVTSLEIALPASCPDVVKFLFPDQVGHPGALLLGVNRYGVHAELPAVVSGPLPVPLLVWPSLLPREMVRFAKSLSMDNS